MTDWSGLPFDLAASVAQRLTLFADHLRFAAACTAWRSAATAGRPQAYLPYLMIPDVGNGGAQARRRLLSLSGDVHRLTLPEESREWRFFSSSDGWLITASLDAEMFLFNPLSGSRVDLPGFSRFPEVRSITLGRRRKGREKEEALVFHVEDHPGYGPRPLSNDLMQVNFLHRGCVSSDGASDLVVMLIYGGVSNLAFARPGDSAWIPVKTPFKGHTAFSHLVYHQGKFYAVDYAARVVTIEITPNKPTYTVNQIAPSLNYHCSGIKYLVFLPSGDLILLVKHVELNPERLANPYKIVGFDTLKLVYRNGRTRWMELDGLPDCTIFIGRNPSFAISSSSIYRNNCIYFTDDDVAYYCKQRRGGQNNGVYSLEDKCFEPLYPTKSVWIMPPPIWVRPNLK